MRRNGRQSDQMPGQDSFLDIVANMVGILIILVMVVGVRASHVPLAENNPTPDPSDSEKKLARARMQMQSIQSDVHKIHQLSGQVKRDIEVRRLERERLATLVAAIRGEIDSRRDALDTESQQDFDLRRKFAEARQQLEQLQNQKAVLEQAKPQVVTIQNLPTPLSQTVFEREVHFQLEKGRVTYVPMDELLEAFKSRIQDQLQDELKYRDDVLTDEVGPIDGFQLRYFIGRTELSPDVQQYTGVKHRRELIRFEVIPTNPQAGEPVEAALAPQSRFRRAIRGLNPSTSTITIWTYPDSFTEFRKLKAELHSLGFATASRPLPEGEPIAGSPHGSRSSAQ